MYNYLKNNGEQGDSKSTCRKAEKGFERLLCRKRGITLDNKISQLKEILDQSKYTVALCGSGMMEEGDALAIKKQERAYEIEEMYGYSSEEMFTSAFYNTRPELFFKFYKNEIILRAPKDTGSGPALAAMEKAGKLKCIISSNVYDLSQRAGCKNVINLHGSIYDNKCPRCGKKYPVEYILKAKRVPICETCNVPVRPLISLFGEMIDSQKMTKATVEIDKADTLMLLGTNIDSEVFYQYIKYFKGKRMVIIHQKAHFKDRTADLVIIDQPKNVLPKLGYCSSSDNP